MEEEPSNEWKEEEDSIDSESEMDWEEEEDSEVSMESD